MLKKTPPPLPPPPKLTKNHQTTEIKKSLLNVFKTKFLGISCLCLQQAYFNTFQNVKTMQKWENGWRDSQLESVIAVLLKVILKATALSALKTGDVAGKEMIQWSPIQVSSENVDCVLYTYAHPPAHPHKHTHTPYKEKQ